MADIVSLSKARKVRDKADARTIAAANRTKFGRSKSEKAAERQERTTLERHVDAHRVDPKPLNDD